MKKNAKATENSTTANEAKEQKVNLWVRVHTYSEQKPGPFIAMLMGFGVLSWVAGSLLTGDITLG